MNRPRHRSMRPRRGVAMLLVIIALAMATVVTTSYLASRDNSAAIGANVVDAAQARWGAVSALELAVAVMETEADWRAATGGKLVDDHAVGMATVDVDVVDMETGVAPTDATTWVEMTATATVGTVSQVASGYAFVPVSADGVDVDLSEFAVFATDGIVVTDDATITRWPVAPLAGLGRRVTIGTNALTAGSIDFRFNGAGVDTLAITTPGASSSLILNTASPPIDTLPLNDPVPVPMPPSTDEPTPDTVPPNTPLVLAAGYHVVSGTERVDSVFADALTEVAVLGGSTLVVDGDLILQGRSYLRVGPDATVVVFGDTILNDGAIELDTGGSLTMFLGGAMQLTDGYIGEVRVDPMVRDNSGQAPYIDPERIRIYQTSAYTGDPGGDTWRLEANSVAKGLLYAPNTAVEIADTSALYGSVVASTVTLTEFGTIFHDPSLDDRIGYRAQKAPLFDATLHIVDEVKGLLSLDESDLLALESGLGATVQRVLLDLVSAPKAPSGSDPTPRPVPVDFTFTAFGTDVTAWEGQVTP